MGGQNAGMLERNMLWFVAFWSLQRDTIYAET